ncbi:MAG: [acyl-carrier-protein] S-malonyltransferase [Rhodospirillaceae bacterium]|nr:[acyl-carrier-protein] S-malonyltransferase [Rhodospirillaceae bacterium]
MTIALVFPGQGSQAVGMGVDLAGSFSVARETFEEVDESLKQNLFKLMSEGPIETLTLTENAQPAIMSVSLAIMRVLEREGGFEITDKALFVAGHSLGEYSALAAVGSFTLSEAAQLLKTRGKAMQEAVPVGEGGMAALLGANLDLAIKLSEAASEGEVCSPANDNADDQVVISGNASAIDRAVALAPEFGIKRAIPLTVSAPFHCAMMAPAAVAMQEALAKIDVAPPLVPLVANITAKPVQEPDIICRQLVQQVTGMVRWRESVLQMKEEGVDKLVEIGAGKVLGGLLRRIDKEMSAASISDPKGVEKFLLSL